MMWSATCVPVLLVLAGCVEAGTVRQEDGDTAVSSYIVVEVETEPAAMVTFPSVPGDGRALARGDLAFVNVGEASVTLHAVEVSTTAPVTGADVFLTEADVADEPLPVPRTLSSGERFPLKLLFRPDAVDAFQGRVLARFDGDAVLERVLVGSGCDPRASGCVAQE